MASPIHAVVAATDFSFSAHRAARRAGLLARAHGAELKLLHVLDSASAKALLLDTGGPDLARSLRLEAERALDSLAEDVLASGGTVSGRLLREGKVREEVLAAAADSDLLVLGPRGVNPLRDFILGSTAERMARMIERPMLVVKQDPQIPYENVLVPVDFSAHSAAALQFAAQLAPSATLHVLHAFDDSLKGTLRGVGASDEGIAAYCGALQREAEAGMDELVVGLPGRTVTRTVVAGDARALILERAVASRSALIVMGKQGRSWLSEHVLGSVTRLVLERADCDVVVVPAPPAMTAA